MDFKGWWERYAEQVPGTPSWRGVERPSSFTGWLVEQLNAQRSALAMWMIKNGYATGHGDTFLDLLKAFDEQASATFVDEEGTTWTAPTAEAYALACSAIQRRQDELEVIDQTLARRPALEGIPSRREKIEYVINVAKRADELKWATDDLRDRIQELEGRIANASHEPDA